MQTWIDTENIPYGANWDRSIDRALHDALCLVVLVSSESVASDEVQAEWSLALEEGKEVIPLLLEDCDMPRRLRPKQNIDLRGRPLDKERLAKLAKSLRER